jgi:TatD DNase family protein
MFIDSHAHLNFNAYKKDLDKVIKRALEEGVWIINVGSKYDNSKKAVEIAKKYEKGVYAAVGLHPIHLSEGIFKLKKDPHEQEEKDTTADDFDIEKYKELAKSEKVVAIGEIGLDYYYRPKTKTRMELLKSRQKEFFIKQLDIAKELNLPVIFHCRMAHQDMIDILGFQTSFRGVMHCFTGTLEDAKKYLEMGFYIGLNGIIFKLDLDKTIKEIPLEKILIETDCPYLTPPEEEKKRNEPLFVKYIAQKIAKIKNIDYSKVVNDTTDNARKLFGI